MRSQQILGLSLRLFSIWLVINSIKYFSVIPHNLSQNNSSEVYVSIFVGIAHLIAALIIWLFPLSIANAVIPSAQEVTSSDIKLNNIGLLAISILGLWKIIDVLPALTSYLFQVHLNSGEQSMLSTLDATGKADILFMMLEMVIGLILFFYSRKIESLMTK